MQINGTLTVNGSISPLGGLTLAPTIYTPAWTTTGTNNTIGNGGVSGYYAQIGKLTFYRIFLLWGSTTASGNGQWILSLPVASDAFGGVSADAILYDSSTANAYRGVIAAASTTTIAVNYGVSPIAPVGSAAPFTWASGDTLTITGWYIAA